MATSERPSPVLPDRALPEGEALLSALNPAQREAVTTTEGPLLVLAGAGTGKTRVITTRIAYLLSRGVAPAAVLAVTFTNKAAGEMRERLAGLVGRRAREITVGTFHAFCARVLREHGRLLGLPGTFTICDASDQLSAVKSAMRELRVHETTMHPSLLVARLSLAKNRMETPEGFLAAGSGGRDQLVGSVWQRYRELLARTRTLDFDDLLLETVRLLRDHQPVRDHYRKRYRHVLVDEYQDTNHPQYEIVRLIGGGHRNVCVVGDDDQSIYGWRGADVRKILGFHHDFEGAKVVRLQTNYRSTRPILAAANKVIAQNASRHEKALVSARGAGEPVRFVRSSDEAGEAQFVVRQIRDLLRAGEARPRDFAILCRTQVQFRPFEGELRAGGLPYVVAGGMSFFDRKEVRDVVAYLKLAVNPRDETALLRIINTPARGVGKASIDRVLAFATDHGISAGEAFERAGEIEGLSEQAVEGHRKLRAALEAADLLGAGPHLSRHLQRLLEAIDYRAEVTRLYSEPMVREARWAAVLEVLDLAESHARRSAEPSLHAFLEDLALTSGDGPGEVKEAGQDAVHLMTLHAAKGLEYPHVFLVGMEEGFLPHARAVAEGGIEEERRLAYVGITRAMATLTMSFAFERVRYGKRARSVPSRFLFEAQGTELPAGWVGIEATAMKEDDDEEPRGGRGRKKTVSPGSGSPAGGAGGRVARSGARRRGRGRPPRSSR
ncbi:MAG TPA: UvrD-helicase domain-containing protein [Vicinamibacteria bacterium]|nr:UvrD-helicase domain-containing protein [Vicinamibacteria bacterium]